MLIDARLALNDVIPVPSLHVVLGLRARATERDSHAGLALALVYAVRFFYLPIRCEVNVQCQVFRDLK